MIGKHLGEISKADIDDLVQKEVREGRTIDYKEIFPSKSDKDHSEFLSDACSFLNAAGGDLVYGVPEKRDPQGQKTGLPGVPIGLANFNPDQDILRLEDVLRSGLQPRIPLGLQHQPVNGFPAGPVLVLRFQKSWIGPHMVDFKGLQRFYTRNSRGKYLMDVGEIRSAFALSEALPERIQRFRAERLAAVIAGETPVSLLESPKVVLHLVPLTSMDPTRRDDITQIAAKKLDLSPIVAHGLHRRYNLDGYVVYDNWRDTPEAAGYLQVFRNGILEAVDAFMLLIEGKNSIPGYLFEIDIVKAVRRYLSLENEMGIGVPIFVLVSLLGVKGYSINAGQGRPFLEPRLIDRSDLLLPDIMVEEHEVDVPRMMRPAFDALWQAAGWSQSPSYQGGGWEPPGAGL